MANPVMPVLADAAAEALSGVVDAGTGIKHEVFDQDEFDAPTAFANLMNLEANVMQLVAASNQGRVIDRVDGLKIGVYSMAYRIGATSYAYAGDVTKTLTASATTYVYLDSAATLKTSTSAWPGTDHVKLAVVTTNATDVTDVSDRRFENFLIGILNDWASVIASQTVDFNGKGIKNLGGFAGKDWVELTIAAGVITPTQMFHKVDTEADAATDDLDTITATAGERRIIVLAQETGLRSVTIKSAVGNIATTDAQDFKLVGNNKFIVLVQYDDTSWRELTRSTAVGTFSADVIMGNFGLKVLGYLQFTQSALAVAGGVLTPGGRSLVQVSTESGAPTDYLDKINPLDATLDGYPLILRGAASNTVTVKHNTGNIKLANGLDFDLALADRILVLLWDTVDAMWYELFRSPLSIADLKDSGDAIPYPLVHFEGGNLSVGVLKVEIYCPEAFTIKDVTGIVGTAPSGGACIVDIRDDGSSIFTSQAEMVNIADAATQDTSAVKNHAVAAGSIITIEVEVATGTPADLTIAINGFIAPKAEAV